MIFKRLYNKLIAWKYTIGFVDYSDRIVLEKDYFPEVHWIKNKPSGRWFADPFILSVDERQITVLVEDYSFKKRKAVISRMTVDRKSYKVSDITTVIDIPTHLSFPVYFRDNGMVYIYPESTKTGKLTLYEYNEENGHVRPVRDLNPYPVADATIEEISGRRVLLGTVAPNDNGRTFYVYPYYEEDCPSDVEPIQKITFRDKSARNAGRMFKVGEDMIRPAQCSNHKYGECLVFQKLMVDEGGRVSFEELKRVFSPSRRYDLTFHTFNVFDNSLAVVDASGYRYGIIGRILETVREHFRK